MAGVRGIGLRPVDEKEEIRRYQHAGERIAESKVIIAQVRSRLACSIDPRFQLRLRERPAIQPSADATEEARRTVLVKCLCVRRPAADKRWPVLGIDYLCG